MAVPIDGVLTLVGLAQEALYGTYGSGTITPPIHLYDLVNGGDSAGSGNSYPTVNTNCFPNPTTRIGVLFAQTTSTDSAFDFILGTVEVSISTTITIISGGQTYTQTKTLDGNTNTTFTFNISNNTGTANIYIDSSSPSQIVNVDLRYCSLVYFNAPIFLDVESLQLAGSPNLTSLNITDLVWLKYLYVFATGITSLDPTNCVRLILLNIQTTPMTSIDLSNNINLQNLQNSSGNILSPVLPASIIVYQSATGVTSLDISLNTAFLDLDIRSSALSSASVDDLYTQLNSHGLSNGDLDARFQTNTRTSASNTARAALVTKGWDISD